MSGSPPTYTGRVHVRCLSFHAAYRCRHTGECCRAGWDLAVEPHIVEAVGSGRIIPVRSTALAFQPQAGESTLSPARTASGDCGFHIDDRCSLQVAGTEAMLPSACRHFPRIFLQDGRGCLVTLSHFCPTAASMLFDDGPVSVVAAGAPLTLDEPIEGLDARDALPPLLRPGILTDIHGYAAWEEAVVRTLADGDDPETALARIEAATELVRIWRPAAAPLTRAVADAFTGQLPAPVRTAPLSPAFSIVRELTGPHPLMEVPKDFAAEWERVRRAGGAAMQRPVARYLAASAFGNWIAYRSQGLRSIVAWLRACHDVLRLQIVRRCEDGGRIDRAELLESMRMADYIMVHTADSLAFGRAAAALER